MDPGIWSSFTVTEEYEGDRYSLTARSCNRLGNERDSKAFKAKFSMQRTPVMLTGSYGFMQGPTVKGLPMQGLRSEN